MSLYNIRTNLTQNSLTANWDTNSDQSVSNINIGTNFIPTIGGFDGYEDIPVNFSNDRIMEESIIFTSKNSLTTESNDPVSTVKDINLILNPEIIKSRPLLPFRN